MKKELTRQNFKWKTMDGRILQLDEMETRHIFNCMKMCFNHLAERWGGEPIWYNKSYSDYKQHAKKSPKRLAWLVLFFIYEIEHRKDLDIKYMQPFLEIKNQIFYKLLPEQLKQITDGIENEKRNTYP
jgi:hypothetical protein